MSSDWSTASLGTVCEIYQPKTISQKEMSANAAYPVFGANGQIGRYDKYNHEEPQLLITCRGATCGSVNMSAPFSWVTGNAMVIRPKQANLDLKFVEYFFRGAVNLDGVITGAAQPQITRQSLAPVIIPLPPLEEQKQIVAVLNKAFAAVDRARALAEANLADAEELFETVLDALIAKHGAKGQKTNLGAICKFENGDRGKNYPGRKAFVPAGVPFINAGHIDSGVIDWLTMNYIPEEHFHRLGNGKVAENDLLFCLRGSLGKFGKVDRQGFGAIASSLVIVRAGKEVLTGFLGLYFKSKTCANMIAKYAGGAAQPNLSAGDLKKFEIILPNKNAQEKAIAEHDKLWLAKAELANSYRQKLQSIKGLCQSLLQKAFAGELT